VVTSGKENTDRASRGRRDVLAAAILWSLSGVVTKSLDLDGLSIAFYRGLFAGIALIPLVIVYFGIGEVAKTVILFYASFFAGVIVMVEGIGQISPIYVRVARTLGASDAEIFARVIVPLTVPHILTAIRVALGVAWATLVASELIAAQQGLGALIQNASSFFQLDIVYVASDLRDAAGRTVRLSSVLASVGLRRLDHVTLQVVRAGDVPSLRLLPVPRQRRT